MAAGGEAGRRETRNRPARSVSACPNKRAKRGGSKTMATSSNYLSLARSLGHFDISLSGRVRTRLVFASLPRTCNSNNNGCTLRSRYNLQRARRTSAGSWPIFHRGKMSIRTRVRTNASRSIEIGKRSASFDVSFVSLALRPISIPRVVRFLFSRRFTAAAAAAAAMHHRFATDGGMQVGLPIWTITHVIMYE